MTGTLQLILVFSFVAADGTRACKPRITKMRTAAQTVSSPPSTSYCRPCALARRPRAPRGARRTPLVRAVPGKGQDPFIEAVQRLDSLISTVG